MRIEHGILSSKLVTDNPEILQVLYDKYGFHVPGYQYVGAYKNRRWDGKKRHFKKSGEFKSGLTTRIIKDMESIGCEDFEDSNSKPKDKIYVTPVDSFKYRDYQTEAIQHCLDSGRCILDSPTGSGKTLIMAGIVKSLLELNPDMKGIVLFKEKGILNQTYNFFKKCGIDCIGINSGEGYEDGQIMLTTVQSIERVIHTHLEDSTLMMIDEAHQFCKGETTIAAIESFPNATMRFAFTATVPGEGAKDVNARMVLEGAFGEVYTTRTAEDLIKDGKLAKPIIQIVEYDPVEPADKGISYQEAYEQHIVESDQRNTMIGKIANMVQTKNPKAKILVLVKNLRHIENLKPYMKNCFTVEGKDNIEDRYKVINKFVNHPGSSVIIGTNVMQTGISIDEITHMINARGLEGEIPTIQGLGRGIRKAEGKDTMYFYDFYDKVPYLEKHSKARIKHYTNLKFEVNHVKL
tara:strand:+ start:4694 stop:6082 length:1389 start_codon:yes stop_codon:yes gene_type:complete